MVVELSIGLIGIGATSYAVWRLRKKKAELQAVPRDRTKNFVVDSLNS